tara:strand:+ start:200 stop:511 length:312 start_codon:yes stop_codon:yes gene_type:complete
MGDNINNLPINNQPPTNHELKIVKELFEDPEHQETINTSVNELKDYILAGILFLVFSLKGLDNLLKNNVAIFENSDIILVLFKALLFIIIFYIVRNFVLAFKQ